jgi:KEOPS complex subunit Cgi121
MRLAWALVRGPLPEPRLAAERAALAGRAWGSAVQLVRPGAVLGEAHLRSAAQHAERALREGRGRAEGLALEFLRYLSGERQIRRALEAAGLAQGAGEALIVALGGDAEQALQAAARDLGGAAEPVAWPERGEMEERALERVALLDVER